nr:DUF4118 domain-containing protein [Bradyrhizobium sp.]
MNPDAASESGTSLPAFLAWLASSRGLRDRGWLADLAGIALFGLALAVRFAVDDLLPTGFPYLTFFPAVILAAFVCGLRPAIVCAVLSGLAAWYFFIPPRYSFGLDASTILALAFYVFIVAVDISLIHIVQVAADKSGKERDLIGRLLSEQRTMFGELQHRVANNMQFVAALLSLQASKVRNDPSQALHALDEARLRLESISRIHRSLYDPQRINLSIGSYLQELCADVLKISGASHIVCVVDAPAIRLNISQLTTLSLLVVELVTNSLKHAFEPETAGTISLNLEQLDGRQLRLTVADDGRGFPESFDPSKTRSLGVRIVQGLALQLGGTISYSGQKGTVARLVFSAA